MPVREILLDARDLEPPEPFERAVAALTHLQPGEYLRLIVPRRPRLLYPWLDGHGYHADTRARDTELFEVFIWRADDPAGAQAAADSP